MKHLIPQVKYYKAALHCHTNISDGTLSPEETIARYKAAGYSILSLTDHNVICDHSDKSTEDFLRFVSRLDKNPHCKKSST